MTPAGLFDQLCRIENGTSFFGVKNLAEETLTPGELSLLAKERLPSYVRLWVDSLLEMGGFSEAAPQSYEREIIAPDVELLRDPRVPPSRKCLVIAFTGFAQRLMMPLPCVLQYLPSDTFDLVLLKDRSRLLFGGGIGGYAGNLMKLCERLAADFSLSSYWRAIAYGTSGGGFAALRAGILMRLPRAISVSGRITWQVRPILDRRVSPAFDPLCACIDPGPTRLVCVYANEQEADRRDAEIVLHLHGGTGLPLAGSGDHNVIVALRKANKLARFYGELFGETLPDQPMPQDQACKP